MENKEAKSVIYYVRFLHRYIGFFVIGITVLYGISGITLIYRDTDFLKQERQVEKQLPPNLKESELGRALHMRNIEITKTEGNIVYLKNGTYNKETGLVQYTDKALPEVLDKINGLHKSPSQSTTHLFSVLYGILLLFLAVSSFWMFKPKSLHFRQGIITAGVGFVFAVILLFI